MSLIKNHLVCSNASSVPVQSKDHESLLKVGTDSFLHILFRSSGGKSDGIIKGGSIGFILDTPHEVS
jgi:hypothetical protein